MSNEQYTIKNMHREDVDIAIKWAAEESWNPGVHDADSYFVADPNGFFIGLINNEPISVISAIKYGKSFGFIGFYIVKAIYRKKHFGTQLINTALKYLDGRNVGCDSVVAQQYYYEKLGFKPTHRNIRFEGESGGMIPTDFDIIKLSDLPFHTINAYDKHFFPDTRPEFLKSWIHQKDSHALGVIKKGALLGYGVIRKCLVGYKIGPLFADHLEIAECLFLALKSKVENIVPIFLDVPEVNQAGLEMAERYNMKPSFETVRMYIGNMPEVSINSVFGITSFEAG